MTRPDDRFADMLSATRLDAAIDQAMNDATVSDDVAPFAGFVDDLRVMADRPAPPPSPQLAALLAGHRAAAPAGRATVTALRQRPPRRVQARAATRMRVAALGLAGKAAMVIAFATSAVAGAAAGILPEPANHFVQRAIEVVTPFELPATGQDAHEDAMEAADTAAAGQPGDATPDAGTRPTPTVHPPVAARAPADSGEPVPDATPPASSSSAKDTGNAAARQAEPGASAPRGRPHTNLPAAPHASDDEDNGRSPDHEPPADPAPKNGHIPPGHAPPGTPPPGGGPPGDTPGSGPDSGPEPLSTPKGPPPKVGSPGGPSQAPGRQGPHDGRTAGPGPAQDPQGQAPSTVPRKPQSNVPNRPQGPGPAAGGDTGRTTQGHLRQDPAPAADGRRAASHRRGEGPRGTEHSHHANARRDTGAASAPATDAGPAPGGAPGSVTPPPPA